jgi:hypothetical protein
MNAYSILFFFKTSVSVFGDYFESLHVMKKIPFSSPLGGTLWLKTSFRLEILKEK